MSRYQKGKPIWILLKQETVSGSGIGWTICKSAPCSRQITMPAPHNSVFTGRMPFLPPNRQRQSTVALLLLTSSSSSGDNNNNNNRNETVGHCVRRKRGCDVTAHTRSTCHVDGDDVIAVVCRRAAMASGRASMCACYNKRASATRISKLLQVAVVSRQGLNWGKGDPTGSHIRHLLFEIHYLW